MPLSGYSKVIRLSHPLQFAHRHKLEALILLTWNQPIGVSIWVGSANFMTQDNSHLTGFSRKPSAGWQGQHGMQCFLGGVLQRKALGSSSWHPTEEGSCQLLAEAWGGSGAERSRVPAVQLALLSTACSSPASESQEAG